MDKVLKGNRIAMEELGKNNFARCATLLQDCVETAVRFGRLGEADIAAYVAGGEPLDKAGAYGIQGGGARFIEHIEGCYYNVVGLPLFRLCRMLGQAGFNLNPS